MKATSRRVTGRRPRRSASWVAPARFLREFPQDLARHFLDRVARHLVDLLSRATHPFRRAWEASKHAGAPWWKPVLSAGVNML